MKGNILQMKILMLSWHKYPHIGGKSTHISSLINGYKKYDCTAKVLTLFSIYGLIFNLIRILMLPIKLLSKHLYTMLWHRLAIFMFSIKILDEVKKERYDIINAQDALSTVAAYKAKNKFGLNIVTTMHTYFGIENSLDNKLKQGSQIYHKMLIEELKALQISDAFIAVDNRIKNHIKEFISQNNVKNIYNVIAIPNFTNVDYFAPVESIKKCEIKNQFNIASEAFVVICARRLVEKNGVIFAIKAMNLMKKQKNICLLIVGDGPQRGEIEQLIKKDNLDEQVIIYGETQNENIRNLYWCADASVVPSITVNNLQEATSISAIEAMACGLPTIASDIGGLSELITNNDTGILVPEQNPEAIAEAIMKLYRDREIYNRIKESARDYIVNHHSHSIAAKKYLSEIQKLGNQKVFVRSSNE